MTDATVELALLAMDAYDQGYNQGLLGIPQGIGAAVGEVSIIWQSPPRSVSANRQGILI